MQKHAIKMQQNCYNNNDNNNLNCYNMKELKTSHEWSCRPLLPHQHESETKKHFLLQFFYLLIFADYELRAPIEIQKTL